MQHIGGSNQHGEPSQHQTVLLCELWLNTSEYDGLVGYSFGIQNGFVVSIFSNAMDSVHLEFTS